MPKTARRRDFRQVMEASGISGRVLDEYRFESDALAGAGDGEEMRIGGMIVADDQIGFYWDGEATSPGMVRDFLKARGGEDMRLLLNSPGGDYFAGVEMMNALKAYEGRVSVEITGLAASAASLVAMGGDEVEMQDATFMMIHRAWTVAIGNGPEMQAVARRLELLDAEAAKAYAAKSGKDPDEMLALMDGEEWMGAEAAVEIGLADRMRSAMPDEEEDEEPTEEEEDEMKAAAGKATATPDKEDRKADEVRERSFAFLVSRLAVMNGDE